MPASVSRTSGFTSSVASPASTRSTVWPTSTQPLTARCKCIDAFVGSETPFVLMKMVFMPNGTQQFPDERFALDG